MRRCVLFETQHFPATLLICIFFCTYPWSCWTCCLPNLNSFCFNEKLFRREVDTIMDAIWLLQNSRTFRLLHNSAQPLRISQCPEICAGVKSYELCKNSSRFSPSTAPPSFLLPLAPLFFDELTRTHGCMLVRLLVGWLFISHVE